MKLFNSAARKERKEDHRQAVYKAWGPISAKGKLWFVFVKATYGWALQVFLLYTIIMYVLSRFIQAFYFDWLTVVIALFMFVLFGVIQGSLEFDRNEKIYREKYPYGHKKKR